MSAFRDDRDLLKQRIGELEEALTRAESRADKTSLESRLNALTERVAAKRADLDEDKKALGELAEALDKMARELRPEPAAPPAPSDRAATEARSTGTRWVLMGLSVLAICIGVFLVVASGGGGRPQTPALKGGAEQLPGWPSALDPVALLPQMQARVGRGRPVELGSVEIRYLSSSGRFDVTGKGYSPSLVYQFVHRPPAPEETARPLGVPPPARPFATTHTVTIDGAGLVTETDVIAVMAPRPVPPPRCSTAQVWAAAMASGAPEAALATLRYQLGNDGAGRWKFDIAETDIGLEIADGSCRVVSP
ncbi:MAG: hypothetical protein WKG00_17630 [Polyangiaceae bacterium]